MERSLSTSESSSEATEEDARDSTSDMSAAPCTACSSMGRAKTGLFHGSHATASPAALRMLPELSATTLDSSDTEGEARVWSSSLTGDLGRRVGSAAMPRSGSARRGHAR